MKISQNGSVCARKAVRYWREVDFCLRAGADAGSRFRMAAATLWFHASNGLGIAGPHRPGDAQKFTMRLGSQKVDLHLRPNSGDWFVFHEVFLNRCYELCLPWRSEVRTVVDLGANVGLTTLYYSQMFPSAGFVAVEPDPDNTTLLRRNLAALGSRAQIIEGAVSDRSALQRFDDSGWSWGRRLCENVDGGRVVRSYSMDEILATSRLNRVDLLKVDIEGAETRLFRGGNSWLDKVEVIIIELHSEYSVQTFAGDVANRGFRVFTTHPTIRNQLTVALSPRALARLCNIDERTQP